MVHPASLCAQVIDPHTHQYLDRLKDEPLFLALAQKVLICVLIEIDRVLSEPVHMLLGMPILVIHSFVVDLSTGSYSHSAR